MKTNRMVYLAVATIVFVSATFAQDEVRQTEERGYFPGEFIMTEAKCAATLSRYAESLKSDNNGVVESCLAHLAVLKLLRPAADFSIVQKEIEAIQQNSPSVELRYKAYLVKTVFDNPGLFGSTRPSAMSSPEELFHSLASRMNEMIAEG